MYCVVIYFIYLFFVFKFIYFFKNYFKGDDIENRFLNVIYLLKVRFDLIIFLI